MIGSLQLSESTNRRHLYWLLVLAASSSVYGSDQALLGNHHLSVLPATAKVSEYVIITGFTTKPEQYVSESEAGKDQTSAMRIDFHPFENNFNLTAGLAQTSGEEEIQSGLSQDSTYLGIGWQKLSDNSELGLRMDLGAVYKSEASGLPGSSGSVSETVSGSDNEKEDWRPVVSIGVSYRF